MLVRVKERCCGYALPLGTSGAEMMNSQQLFDVDDVLLVIDEMSVGHAGEEWLTLSKFGLIWISKAYTEHL